MTYYENPLNQPVSYNRDARLRAIALNAGREAVIAFGRIDQPYTDSDAAIVDNIYAMLVAIGEESNVFREQEHQNLSVQGNSPSATQFQIAQILDGHNVGSREETKPTATKKSSAAKA